MKRNIIFSEFDNPARIFGGILKDLEKVANGRKLPVQDVIRMFIADLQNSSNEDYEKKVQEIHIKGDMSVNLKRNLIDFLNKGIKRHSQQAKKNKERARQADRKKELETIWETVEKTLMQSDGQSTRLDLINKLITEINEGTAYAELKKEQKIYILKKLNELEEKENRKLEEEKVRKIKSTNKKWEEIVEIVDKESANTGKSKLELWEAISGALFGENKVGEFDLEVPKSIKEDIKTLVYGKIKSEGAEYYEDVKRYTQDFEFLTGFRGVSFAVHGHRKFSNSQYAEMFEDLVATLRKNEKVEYPEGEEKFLKRVLSNNIVDTYYGKKIIKGRIDKIKRDKRAELEAVNNKLMR